MARSALMRLVQQLSGRARPAPTDDREATMCARRRRVQAREQEHREARRAFLRRGGGLLAGSALSPALVAASAPQQRTRRVAVVGAGLAGLSCAWQLSRMGIVADVYEAAPRVGGRCLTERKAFDGGQVAERGGELIDTAHDEIIDLALSLDLALDDLHAATPKGTDTIWHFGGRRYTEAQAAADFARLWPVLARDGRALGESLPTFAAYTSVQRNFDRMTAREWLSTRVSGGADAPLAKLLANAYVEELGADLDDISAVTVIDLLRGSPQNRVSPYEVSDQRYHVRGGNDLIVSRMADALGARVQTSTRLAAMARQRDGRYRLTFARDQAMSDATFDDVVLAVPFTMLVDVDVSSAGFRARKIRAITELGMGRNTKLQLQFSERAWVTQRGNGETRSDGSYHVSWEVTRGQPGVQGILNFYTGGSLAASTGNGSSEDRAREVLRDLEAVHPGIARHFTGRVIRNAWDRYPWSRGSYSLLKPGQYTTIHGIESLPEGRVRFAGEQSSVNWYGYLNGAVDSGLRAAREVANGIALRRAA
ncbi:MAG TPA: FAD-dependent oxidoreductase [Casimicrobiaceae bacterium]|nr:FAD-dependent oxidoreductase [Casimicrobiaceae bacterium]